MTANRDAEVCGICGCLTMSRRTTTCRGDTIPICGACARSHGAGRPSPHYADGFTSWADYPQP